MQYIPLNTYFDANFQTRLYYSDRQNLLNWLNELDGTEIKNIQFGGNNQKYQTSQEQYYSGMEESTKKKNRAKSQSVPGYAIWLQSQETFNSTTKYNIDLESHHTQQDKSSQQPSSFGKKRSNNQTNRPPHPHNHHSTQPNQYYFTTRTEVRPQQGNSSYQQALQIKKDIERIKREIEQLKKMKEKTKSSEMSYFEKRVGAVEEACKECERRVEGNKGKSMNENETREKSLLQEQLKDKSSNKNTNSRNHSKKYKKKRKNSMSSKQCHSQKPVKSDKDLSQPLQSKQTHPHINITPSQLTHFQHLKLLQQQFQQIQQLVNSKLLNYHKNKSFAHQNPKLSLNRTEQRTSGLVLDSSFHYSPSKQAIQEKSLLAELEGVFERMEREIVYNQREFLKVQERTKEQEDSLIRKNGQLQTMKFKLQKLQTQPPKTQPVSSPLNLCTSCLPKSNVSSSSNTLSRTQTQLSVCRNNFKSFFTIIKNTLLRQPSIKQSLPQQSLKQLSQAELSKQGKVEKGMEIMVRCLDGLVSENLRLKIELESKENACNRSFSYVETRIEKTINQHVLDQLERSRHSIEKNYRVAGSNERTHEKTHRSTTSTSNNNNINPNNSHNPIKTTSTLHLPTQPSLPLQLQSQLQQLKLQLSSKDHTILKLSQLLQQKQLQLQKLHIFIQKNQLRLKSTQQLTQTQQKTIEQLKYYIEERQYQLKKVQQLLQHKQDENKDLEKYLTKVETLALQVRDENATLKDLMDEWRHENSRIKDQKAALLQYVAQLEDKEKRLDMLVSDRDSAIGQLKSMIKQYEQGYRQLEERYYEEIENKLKREDSSNNSNSNSDQVNGNSNNNNSNKHNSKNNKPILIKDSKQHHENNSNQDNYNPNSSPSAYPTLASQSLIQLILQRDTAIQSLQQQNSHLQQKLQNNLQLMLTFRNQCNDLQQQINLLNRINNQGQMKKGQDGGLKESRRVISGSTEVIEERPEREEESGKKQQNWSDQLNIEENSNNIITSNNHKGHNNIASPLIAVRNNNISAQVRSRDNTSISPNNTDHQPSTPSSSLPRNNQCSNCLKLSNLITKLRQQNNTLHQKLFYLEHKMKQLHEGRLQSEEQQDETQRNDTFFRYNNIKNQYMEKVKNCDHNWKEGDLLEDQLQVKQVKKEEERWQGEGGNFIAYNRGEQSKGEDVSRGERNRVVIDGSTGITNHNRERKPLQTTTTITSQDIITKNIQSNPNNTTNTTNTNNKNNTPHCPSPISQSPSQLLHKIQQLQHKITQLQQQLSDIQGHNHNTTNQAGLQQQPQSGLCSNCLKELGGRQQGSQHQDAIGDVGDDNGSRLVSGIEQQREEEGLLRKRSSRFNNHGSSIIKSNSGASAIRNNFTQRKNSQIIVNPNNQITNNINTNNNNINNTNKSNNKNSNTLQPNIPHSNSTHLNIQHYHPNQQHLPTYHNQSFQSHQSRQSIPRRQPSTLLNQLQIQGFNQRTLSNINNPLSSRTTLRKEDDDEHPLRQDSDRQHHQSPITSILPQNLLPSHLQLPLPYQPRQQQQQSPDDNLLKRNRGDRRPSFLVYKDNTSLFNVLGWDSQRTRRVDPKDTKEHQDKNTSNIVAKITNNKIGVYNNNNSSKIIEQPIDTSLPTNTNKQSQKSSIQENNNRNLFQQQQEQSGMNSPKRKLRRDSSSSSVIVMDLDKSYRHDVSVSRNEQEQDVVSPIEKLKRKHLQGQNNRADNNDDNNMVNHNDNQYQQEQLAPNDKSVRFNLNPIRQLSYGSQSTSRISSHSNKKKQLAELQNNLQTQIQPINQNNQNIALSGDSANTNSKLQFISAKGNAVDNRNNTNNNASTKQLLDIISALRQQNQFLSRQFERLNHEFIQLEKWKELQCNRRIQALALGQEQRKGGRSGVNGSERKEELDRTIINLLKTEKLIEEQAKQSNRAYQQQGIGYQQPDRKKEHQANKPQQPRTSQPRFSPIIHNNPTVIQSQVIQLHFSQQPLTHESPQSHLIHEELQFLRQLLVNKQSQLQSKEKLILTNEEIRQLLVELKRLLEEKEKRIEQIRLEVRKREEESSRLRDEVKNKEQELDEGRRTLISRGEQLMRGEQELRSARQQVRRKEEEIGRLLQMITAKDTTIITLNSQLDNIKQHPQYNNQHNPNTQSHKQPSAQPSHPNTTLTHQNHKLCQQINRLCQQKNALKQQLTLLKQQNIRLLAQNQASQHTQSIIVEQYDNRVGQLVEKVSQLLEENEGLKSRDKRDGGDNDNNSNNKGDGQDVLQLQRKHQNNNDNNNNNSSNGHILIGGEYNPPMGPQVNLALKQLQQQQQHQRQERNQLFLQHNSKQLLKQHHNNTNKMSQHHGCTTCNCQEGHQPHNHITTDHDHHDQPISNQQEINKNPLQSFCCIITQHHYVDEGQANQNQITKMELEKDNFVRSYQVEAVKIIENKGLSEENQNNRREEQMRGITDRNKVLDDEMGYQNVVSYQHQVRLGQQYTTSNNINNNKNNINNNNNNGDINRGNTRSTITTNTPTPHPSRNPFTISCQPCLCISINPFHPTSTSSLAYSQSPLPHTSHLVNQTKLLPQTVQLTNDHNVNHNVMAQGVQIVEIERRQDREGTDEDGMGSKGRIGDEKEKEDDQGDSKNENKNRDKDSSEVVKPKKDKNNGLSNNRDNSKDTQLPSNHNYNNKDTQLQSLNQHLTNINQQLITITNQLTHKNTIISTLSQQLEKKDHLLNYKDNQLTIITNQNNYQKQVIDFKQEQLDRLIEGQQGFEWQVQQLKEQIRELQQRAKVLQDRNRQLLQEMNEVRKRKGQIEQQLQRVKQENNELLQQLNDIHNHNHNTISHPAISHQQQPQHPNQQANTPSHQYQQLHSDNTLTQLQHLKQQHSNVNPNLLNHQSQLQHKQQLQTQTNQQITVLNQQLQKLRLIVKEKQQQLKNNRVGKQQQVDKSQNRIQVDLQVERLNQELLAVRQQLHTARQQIKHLGQDQNSTHDRVNGQVGRDNRQLNMAKEEINTVKQQLNAVNTQLNRANTQLNRANTQLDRAKTQLNTTNNQLQQSTQQITQLTQQLHTTNQSSQSIKSQLQSTQQQLQSTMHSLTQALKQNQTNKKIDQQLTKAKQYIEKLQLTNSQNTTKIRDQDQRLLKLVQQVEVNSRMLGDKSRQLSVKSKETQLLKRQLQQVKQQLQSTNRQLQQQKHQLQQLTNTPPPTTDPALIEQLKSKIISLLSIINEHSTQLQQLTSSKDNSINQLEQQLFHLKQSNIFHEQENAALRKALQERDHLKEQSQQLGDKQVKSQKVLLKRKNSNRGDGQGIRGDRDKNVLQSMIDKHRAEILLLHKQLREYELQINKLKQQRQSLQGTTTTKGRQTQLTKHTLQSMIQQHKRQIAQLHTQLRSYQTQIRNLRGQAQHQISDNQVIPSQNPSNQHLNHSLNTSHNSQQLNLLKVQLQQLRAILQNRQKTYIKLLEQKDIQIEQLKGQSNKRNEIQSKQREIAQRHQEQLKKKNEEIRKKTEQVKRKDQEIKRKEQQIGRKNIQLNKLKDDTYRQSTKQKQQLQTKLKTALTNLSQSNQILKTTQNQLTNIKSRYDDKISQKQRIITKQGQQLINNRKMIEKLKHQIQQQNNNAVSNNTQSPRQSQFQSNISMKRSEQVTHNDTNLNLVSRTKNQNNERKQLFQIHNLVKVYVRNQNNGSYVVTNKNQSDQTHSHLNNQPEYEFEICHVDQQGNSQVKLIKQGSQFLQGNEVENLISNQITKQISKINSVHTDQQNNNNNNGNSNSVGQSRRSIYSKVEQTRSANLNQPIAKSPPKPTTKSPPKSQPQSIPNPKLFARSPVQKQSQQTTQQQTKPTRARSVQQFYLQSIVPQFFRKKNNQSVDKKEEENKKK